MEDANHDENYWVSCHQNKGFICHFLDKNVWVCRSLKAHDEKVHNFVVRVQKKKPKAKNQVN